MNSIQEVVKNSKKIVIKIGSNVLSDENGNINRETMQNIVKQVNDLIENGKQVILVSSGAGVCGVGAINKWSRRNDINYKQALCAIGQVELMMGYKEFFKYYGFHVAQILLTGEDFENPHRTLNIRNVMFTLIDEGVVPVINENDSVSVDEIKIGDNDTLAAKAAILWNADLLVELSDIDGVFNKDPKTFSDAVLIDVVEDTDKLQSEISIKGKSEFGTGGIRTKLNAADMVNGFGIPMLLLNGKHKDILNECADGEGKGTLFLGKLCR